MGRPILTTPTPRTAAVQRHGARSARAPLLRRSAPVEARAAAMAEVRKRCGDGSGAQALRRWPGRGAARTPGSLLGAGADVLASRHCRTT